MSTDFQHGRVALGQRLRELRAEGGLTGRELAQRLGWPQSKVSKLETGQHTATVGDVRAWAEATGRAEATRELTARLWGLESRTRSWRRELAAGHRPAQELINIEYERSAVMRAWEAAMIVGVLQTADYAWHVFSAYSDLMQSPRDTDDAVRARLKRQEILYQSDKQVHIVMSEAALRALICPPAVLAAQLDRIGSVIGLDTVSVGIVPWTAALKIPPANGFWIYDDRLVIVEEWHAELWLDDAESIALYRKVFDTLRSSAVYGAEAHRVIARARRALDAS